VQKKAGRGRNFAVGCLALLILVAVIAVLSSGNKPTTGAGGAGAGATATTSCSPKPCANADGFTLSVSGLERDLPAGEFSKPEAGNHFVLMYVTMHNGSNDKRSANPFLFSLRDSQGQEHPITFSMDPKCGTWQAVDLAPGASLGPKPLCFEASGTPSSPLTLIWTPEFFRSKVEIPLQ
jgi:hypothetical protein